MTDWNPNDPDATRVYYDLSSWSIDHQAELAAAMADADIPHAWEGTELMVPEESEVAADELIAELEVRLGIDSLDVLLDAGSGTELGAGAAVPIALGDDAATTEYDLGEWTDAEHEALGHALADARIPHRWEDRVLLVGTADEAVVDGLLDEIERGEYIDTARSESTDPAEQLPFEILTTFFLAGERLRRDPLDANGLEQLLAATDVADPDAPPFGVQPRLWQQTCALADRVADALVGGDEPDHDAAMEAAGQLHDLLRPSI